MRSSSGGWVSNRRFSRDWRPSARVRGTGCSIQRWAVAARRRVHDGRVVPELLEGGDQAGRVAGQHDAAHVGQRLPPAAHRRLHQPAGQRGEQQQDEAEHGQQGRRPSAAAALVVAVAGTAPPHEPQAEVGQEHDHPDEGHGEGRNEDVVVLDVAELVGEDPFELDPVELLHQAGRHRHRRVAGVAAGGEGVGRVVLDDVDPRLREPAGDAQALDQVVEPGVGDGVGRSGVARGQGDGVALPVGQPRADHRHHQRDERRRPAPSPNRSWTAQPTATTSSDEGPDEQGRAPLVRRDLFGQQAVRVAGDVSRKTR